MSASVSALCWIVILLLRSLSILAFQSPPSAFYNPITGPSVKHRDGNTVGGTYPGDFQNSLLRETLRGGIEDDSSFVTIERVSSRDRALDVRVFRGWSVTAEEYMQQQCQNGNRESTRRSGLTHSEAVKELTKSYNDEGVDTAILGDEPLVNFVAIYHHGDDNNIMQTTREGDDSLAFMRRTNGVVGTVDCQVKHHDILSPTATPESIQQFLSKSNLPWPHLYTKNLHVDSRMRRRGIALALVRANSAYACKSDMKNMILTVDPNNETGAIQLYEREGFRFMGGTVEGVMICPLLPYKK
jgi:ribosomal protein S18 acetylase RimI-like enzyme